MEFTLQMGSFDSEITNAVAYGVQGQWKEAEEHAMAAIKLNKKDERVSTYNMLLNMYYFYFLS
jgi:hypothetical protein